jgi:hypothetical protein
LAHLNVPDGRQRKARLSEQLGRAKIQNNAFSNNDENKTKFIHSILFPVISRFQIASKNGGSRNPMSSDDRALVGLRLMVVCNLIVISVICE